MNTQSCMTRKMVVAQIHDSIYDTSNLMKKYDIGFLPVARDQQIVGVITDRDLVVRAMANNADSDGTIENYITKDIVQVDAEDSIKDAFMIMGKERVKRLLVTHQNKVVGILSLSDLINKDLNADSMIMSLKELWKINYNDDESHTEIDEFYL